MKALRNTTLFCINIFLFAWLCNATEFSDFFVGWLVGTDMTISIAKLFEDF